MLKFNAKLISRLRNALFDGMLGLENLWLQVENSLYLKTGCDMCCYFITNYVKEGGY